MSLSLDLVLIGVDRHTSSVILWLFEQIISTVLLFNKNILYLTLTTVFLAVCSLSFSNKEISCSSLN